jgi:hypothetical protein
MQKNAVFKVIMLLLMGIAGKCGAMEGLIGSIPPIGCSSDPLITAIDPMFDPSGDDETVSVEDESTASESPTSAESSDEPAAAAKKAKPKSKVKPKSKKDGEFKPSKKEFSSKVLARKAELARQSRRRKKAKNEQMQTHIDTLQGQIRKIQGILAAAGTDDKHKLDLIQKAVRYSAFQEQRKAKVKKKA